jgi:hypothetical protein
MRDSIPDAVGKERRKKLEQKSPPAEIITDGILLLFFEQELETIVPAYGKKNWIPDAGDAFGENFSETWESGHPKRHEKILREAYQAFHRTPEIMGYVPWALMDVRVPMHWRWYNRGSGTFAYGLLDNDYRKKHVFDVVKEEISKLRKHYK